MSEIEPRRTKILRFDVSDSSPQRENRLTLISEMQLRCRIGQELAQSINVTLDEISMKSRILEMEM